MGNELATVMPVVLLLSRISAFILVSPIFGWRALPRKLRVGLAMVLTMFFLFAPHPQLPSFQQIHWMAATMMVVGEVICGLAIGLMVSMVFHSMEQGGRLAARQMGFAMAQVINPVTGQRTQPIAVFFEITFSMFFLASGGHHVLIEIIAASYDILPIAQMPDIAQMTEGLVHAGSVMLLYALRLAAPLVAAFLLLTVVLGVLARAVPEMNIMMVSFPIRIGLGLILATAMVPYLNTFNYEITGWMIETFSG